MKKYLLIILLMSPMKSLFAGIVVPPGTYYVGDGSGQCIYTSIQDAIDAASPGSEIRVTTDAGTFNESIAIEKNLTLKGGYSSCGLAQLDDRTDTNRSVIDAGGVGTVMLISGNNIDVDVSGFVLQNGTNIGFSPGGGVTLSGIDSEFDLTNLIITNNNGLWGGGIYVGGGNVTHLIDTKIVSNTAELGGGLYCSLGAEVHFQVGSGVTGNQAVDGGGIYASGCEIELKNGQVHNGAFSVVGVSLNSASDFGGGIYLDNSTLRFKADHLNGHLSPTNIDNNTANTDGDSVGDGGGIYAIDSSINIAYSYFYQNKVLDGNGGAIYLHNSDVNANGTLGCQSVNEKCVWFEKNTAQKDDLPAPTVGGAIYASNDSQVATSGDPLTAYFIDNRADFASAFSVSSGAEIDVQSSYFVNNGNDGNDETLDASVVRVNGGTSVANVYLSTFANNSTGAVFKLENSGTLDLRNNIVTEPSDTNEVMAMSMDSSFSFRCNIVHESDSMGNTPPLSHTTVSENPGFVDAGNGDYHIRHDSIAVDACNIFGIDDNVVPDRDNSFRPTSISGISNGTGNYDIGADEYVDLIYKNSFEGVGISFK